MALHEIAHVQLGHSTPTRERDLAADEQAARWAVHRLGWTVGRVMCAASFLLHFPPDAVHADGSTRLTRIEEAASDGFASNWVAALLG